ncbi:CpsD/CapB family tyrosine-protein kinase [Flavimaricola marinus]|uniref:Tyrosine-protein kinase YwqD n=1 Tax=Flavimaricola marinus TaxID=1819565 RepID=A0A238LI14_9RHOB|nr:CpsD/CapB family tyrosine-protein kinase [Flavimaricola marinus]SMY09291.1 Tyrosine-protein kinase YwqD [Flavimaricola marinus]
MEKIQHAIAKAREIREAQLQGKAGAVPTTPAPGGPAGSERVATAPAANTVPTPAATAAPTTAAWAAGTAEATPDLEQRWLALPEIQISDRRLRRSRILTSMGGKDSAEFDMIRTRIVQAQRANGWRTIAITSANPSSGKSTLVLNLAFSFARHPEHRTLIAEVDLRRPSLAKTLGVRQGYNFASVLGGSSAFEDNSFRIGKNLIFSTNEKPSRNSSELLQSEQATSALQTIAERYAPTVTLFDMPPMLVGDDAISFLPKVDAAILVVEAEHTTRKQIDLCEREIADQTNVMGIVLNKCRYIDRDQNYGYDYY